MGFLGGLGACNPSSSDVVPATGVIQVNTLTEGSGPFPDSFNVLLNGNRSGSVPPNDVYFIPFLPRGDYQVGLQEESEDCWFGDNHRTVRVELNDTSYSTFLVRCNEGG
jgi:hypothetical protein